MAITSIKSTYSLDVESVRQLEALARQWSVSKSEALRRAIRTAASQQSVPPQDAVDALERLQASLSLTKDAAVRWQNRSRRERRASARRPEGGPS